MTRPVHHHGHGKTPCGRRLGHRAHKSTVASRTRGRVTCAKCLRRMKARFDER